MGNLIDKTLTKRDICYDYFFKDLVDAGIPVINKEFDFELVEDSPVNTIIKVGDIYAGMLNSEEAEYHDIKRIMIYQFIKGICGKSTNIDVEYAKQSVFRDEFLFFVGFSKLNFCKILAFTTATPKEIFNEPSIHIKTVCAGSANKTRIDLYEKETQVDIKTSLGLLALFKTIQYFKDLGYNNIILDCKPDLLPYYVTKLHFSIGTHKKNDYTNMVYKSSGKFNLKRFIEYNIALVESKSIFEKDSYLAVEKDDDNDDYFIRLFFDIKNTYPTLEKTVLEKIKYLKDFFMRFNDDPNIFRSNNKTGARGPLF